MLANASTRDEGKSSVSHLLRYSRKIPAICCMAFVCVIVFYCGTFCEGIRQDENGCYWLKAHTRGHSIIWGNIFSNLYDTCILEGKQRLPVHTTSSTYQNRIAGRELSSLRELRGYICQSCPHAKPVGSLKYSGGFISKSRNVWNLRSGLRTAYFLGEKATSFGNPIEYRIKLSRRHLPVLLDSKIVPDREFNGLPPPDRRYKAVLLFSPEKTGNEIRESVLMLHSLIKKWGGDEISAIYRGRLELAYPVKKRNAARMLELKFRVVPSAIKYLDLRLKQLPEIIRFMIVRPFNVTKEQLQEFGIVCDEDDVAEN